MPPPGTTYGQLQGLAHQLAHLSYVEMYGGAGNGDAQIANVLGDAGVKFFTFMPAAAYSNSVYHRLLHKAAPHAVLHGWYHKYLDPALVDCKNEAA